MAVWAWWILEVIVSFGILEGLALLHGSPTLSRSVWTLQYNWPLFGPLWGLVVGTLSAHFFWGGAVCFAPVH